MVKSLADILSEIEKRESVRTFSMGGSPDEAQDSQYGGDTPSDPGQDDTLGAEDEGAATMDDMQGLIDAGAYGDPNSASAISQAMLDLELANQAQEQNKMDRIIEESAYQTRNPEYMSLITQNPNITTQQIASSLMAKPPTAPTEKPGITWTSLKGVNPLASAAELATGLLTLGWLDPQYDKGDLVGKDLSTGKTQPQGLQVGIGGGINDLMTVLGMALPEIEIDVDKSNVNVVGLPGEKLDRAEQTLAQIGNYFSPASAPPPSDTMTAQAPRADMPVAAPISIAPPSVKDELVATAKASPSQVAAAPATPAAPTPAVEDIVEQMAPTPRDEVPTVDRPSSFNLSPAETEIGISTLTEPQGQQQALSAPSVNTMSPLSPADMASLTPSQTGPANTGIDPEDPHFEAVPSSNMTWDQAKAAVSDLADLFSIDKGNQTAVAQVNPLPSTSKSSKTSTGTPPPDSGEGGNDQEDIITTAIVNNIIDTQIGEKEKEAEQVSNWSFDPSMWYPAAQGGAIDAFSVGGLAGMMMPRQQLSTRYNSRPPQFGGQIPPQPPQFPGFIGPFGPQRTPMQPPQRPKLDAKTYFHEHEGGKVNYPNFPQPYVSPENKPNPFKPGFKPIVDPVRPSRPFQTYPQPILDEAVINQMDTGEQQPIPPVSISETTATALQPDEIQETQATTIEEAPVPREIDIQMPQNITATLDFPEQVRGTANYAHGGLTGLAYNYPEKYGIGGFLKSLIPSLAGAAAMMIPGVGQMASPWIVGGLTGAATGALGGGKKDRTLLGAAKNFLMGGSGASAVGTANPALVGKGIAAVPPGVGTAATPTFMGNISNTASGFASQWDKLGGGELLKKYAGPIAGTMAASSIEPPPSFNEVEIEQIKTMTPEQRRAYIESKRNQYSNRTMQPTTFAPPNVDIGFNVTTAADGGIMEIDEEMESGSFVLPADVVSNVGDGSSDAGHRRLAQLFGGGDDYAIGGGTGILKGPIKGPGGGLDDLIQTGIDGVRVARLSTDEFVVPKDVVRQLGNGSQKAGSEKLYDFMKDVRLKKHGTPDQPKEIHMSGLRKMV